MRKIYISAILAVFAMIFIAAKEPDIWNRKYTPSFGEHVILTTNTWLAKEGVRITPMVRNDGTIVLDVMIPRESDGKYNVELTQYLESRFRQQLDQYLETYWKGRGLTVENFNIRQVNIMGGIK